MALLRLSDPPFVGRTGKGIRVAVVDSGIAANHPHVGAVGAGISFVGDEHDTGDRIGHGTAIAAVLREKAPDAELVPVRVFDRELATDAATLAHAIIWAAEYECRVVNLSLGTLNAAHGDVLAAAVQHATELGSLVVSAYSVNGTPHFPGALHGVRMARVEGSPDLERDAIESELAPGGQHILYASIFPRPIPGVPKERNFHGVSFAVANASAFMARWAEGCGGAVPIPLETL